MAKQISVWNTLETSLSTDEKEIFHSKYVSPFTVDVRSLLNDWIQATFLTKKHLKLDPNSSKDYNVICSLLDALYSQIQHIRLNLAGHNCDLVVSSLKESLQTLNGAVGNVKKISWIYETIRQCLCSEIKLFIQIKASSSNTTTNTVIQKPKRISSDDFSQINSQLNQLNNILINIRKSSFQGINGNGNVQNASNLVLNQFLTKMQDLYLQVELMQLKLVDEISEFNLSPSRKLSTLDQLQDNFVKFVEILRTCRGHLTQLLNKVRNEVAIEIQGKFLKLYNSLVQNSLVILDQPSRILIGKTNFQTRVCFLGGSEFSTSKLKASIVTREEMTKLINCYNDSSKRIVSSSLHESDRKSEVSVDSSKGSKKKKNKEKVIRVKIETKNEYELVLINDAQERVLMLNVSAKLEGLKGHVADFSTDEKGRRIAESKLKIKEIKRTKKLNKELVPDIEYWMILHVKLTEKTSDGEYTMWVYISSFPTRLLTNCSQEMKAMESMVWSSACSAGKTFADVTKSVPWSQFINAVSHEFIRICGLGLNEPQLEFLREKAFGSDHSLSHANLTLERFRDTILPNQKFTLAAWLCGIFRLMSDYLMVTAIKQEPSVEMEPDAWCQSLIEGLNSKTEIEQKLLSTRKNGTTLVRFSETVLGGISVAYLVSDTFVKHLEPLTKDVLKESALATCIMNLEESISMYPNLPKHDVLKKYAIPVTSKAFISNSKYTKWNFFRVFSRAKGLPTSNVSSSSQNDESSPESFSENSGGHSPGVSTHDSPGPSNQALPGPSNQVSPETMASSPEDMFSDVQAETQLNDPVISFSDIETLIETMSLNDFHAVAATLELESRFQKCPTELPEQDCIGHVSEFENPDEGYVSPITSCLPLAQCPMDIEYLDELGLAMPEGETNVSFGTSSEILMATRLQY